MEKPIQVCTLDVVRLAFGKPMVTTSMEGYQIFFKVYLIKLGEEVCALSSFVFVRLCKIRSKQFGFWEAKHVPLYYEYLMLVVTISLKKWRRLSEIDF